MTSAGTGAGVGPAGSAGSPWSDRAQATPGMQLVPVALGAGTIAGVACARSLQGEPALPAGPNPAPVPAAVMD
jgi:hypothetical protein